MQDNNNPFASFGLRGMTTYTRNTLEAFAEKWINYKDKQNQHYKQAKLVQMVISLILVFYQS